MGIFDFFSGGTSSPVRGPADAVEQVRAGMAARDLVDDAVEAVNATFAARAVEVVTNTPTPTSTAATLAPEESPVQASMSSTGSSFDPAGNSFAEEGGYRSMDTSVSLAEIEPETAVPPEADAEGEVLQAMAERLIPSLVATAALNETAGKMLNPAFSLLPDPIEMAVRPVVGSIISRGVWPGVKGTQDAVQEELFGIEPVDPAVGVLELENLNDGPAGVVSAAVSIHSAKAIANYIGPVAAQTWGGYAAILSGSTALSTAAFVAADGTARWLNSFEPVQDARTALKSGVAEVYGDLTDGEPEMVVPNAADFVASDGSRPFNFDEWHLPTDPEDYAAIVSLYQPEDVVPFDRLVAYEGQTNPSDPHAPPRVDWLSLEELEVAETNLLRDQIEEFLETYEEPEDPDQPEVVDDGSELLLAISPITTTPLGPLSEASEAPVPEFASVRPIEPVPEMSYGPSLEVPTASSPEPDVVVALAEFPVRFTVTDEPVEVPQVQSEPDTTPEQPLVEVAEMSPPQEEFSEGEIPPWLLLAALQECANVEPDQPCVMEEDTVPGPLPFMQMTGAELMATLAGSYASAQTATSAEQLLVADTPEETLTIA